MKKILILLVISLLGTACGTRKKTSEKNEIKKQVEAKVKSNSEAVLKVDGKDSELQVSDLSKTKISVIPKTAKCLNLEGTPASPRTMTIKDSKGNEATVPVDENSEIHIENTSELESKLKMTELQLSASKKENINLKSKNEELQRNSSLNVESKKPMLWLYVLLFLSGVAFLPTIKYFIKK